MAERKKFHVNHLLHQALLTWAPGEGPTIEINCLERLYPKVRWDCILLGENKFARNRKIDGPPLGGGRIKVNRVVIIIRHLREWLEVANPDKTKTPAEVIEVLLSEQKRVLAARKELQEIQKLRKAKEKAEEKKLEPKPVKSKAPKPTSNDLWGVWK